MINANNMCTKTSFDVDSRYTEVKSFRNMFDYCSFRGLFVYVLRPSQQFFSHVGTFSCVPGLNQ